MNKRFNTKKNNITLSYIIFFILFCLWAVIGCGTSTPALSHLASNTEEQIELDIQDTKQNNQSSSVFIYKSVGSINLRLYVYQPSVSKHPNNKQTAIVFFHGGSWTTGAPIQFQQQALYFAEHGILSITVEYRLKNKNGTTPFEAVSDAKSAIRWIREHSADLKIDPNRIIASGGSAGGQLAVATAVVDNYNSQSDNLTVSPTPNALVLFNPVLDMQKWKKRFDIDMLAISPLQQLHKPLPPTIIFHGTSDKVAPYSTTVKFVNQAFLLKSSDIRLIPYEKREHGFYNKRADSNSDFESTLKQTYDFVTSLGWQPNQ